MPAPGTILEPLFYWAVAAVFVHWQYAIYIFPDTDMVCNGCQCVLCDVNASLRCLNNAYGRCLFSCLQKRVAESLNMVHSCLCITPKNQKRKQYKMTVALHPTRFKLAKLNPNQSLMVKNVCVVCRPAGRGPRRMTGGSPMKAPRRYVARPGLGFGLSIHYTGGDGWWSWRCARNMWPPSHIWPPALRVKDEMCLA
jgi:hypothetical protein